MTRSKRAKIESSVDPNPIKIFETPNSSTTPKTSNPIDKNEPTKSTQIDSSSNKIAVIEFKSGEIVWAKIRGWCHWPAKIEEVEGKQFVVRWFNDYRKTKVFRTQLFKFHANFDEFSKKFPNIIGLETAAKEAVIYAMNQKR